MQLVGPAMTNRAILFSALIMLQPSLMAAQTLSPERLPTSTGVIVPEREVILAAKIVGRVHAVVVDEGNTVKAGMTVIDIEDAELRANLAAAQATLNREKLNRTHVKKLADRVESLHQQNAASAENLDEAMFRYESTEQLVASASAAVAKAEAQLAETKIKAPFAGVIIEKRVEPGDVTSPGEPLLKLEDHSTLKFRTNVQERDIPLIFMGQQITIAIDALDDLEITATVSKIIPSGNSTTHEFLVEALLPRQEGLFPGMFGKATFGR